MSTTIVTVVFAEAGALDPAREAQIIQRMGRFGAGMPRVDILASGLAADFYIESGGADFEKALRDGFQDFPADVFVQKDVPSRKKKLLVADMDATIVVDETLDVLARRLGLAAQILPVTAAAMRGELDFEAALKQRVALLRGVALSVLEEESKKSVLSKGSVELLHVMNKFGARCILISGGFNVFTEEIAARLSFYKNFGNMLLAKDGFLTGEVAPPILDKFRKRQILEDACRALGLGMEDVLAVGDGANDIPMLTAAGAGVGYFAKPAVEAAVLHRIRHTDLTALLYMQGYRAQEIYQNS